MTGILADIPPVLAAMDIRIGVVLLLATTLVGGKQGINIPYIIIDRIAMENVLTGTFICHRL